MLDFISQSCAILLPEHVLEDCSTSLVAVDIALALAQSGLVAFRTQLVRIDCRRGHCSLGVQAMGRCTGLLLPEDLTSIFSNQQYVTLTSSVLTFAGLVHRTSLLWTWPRRTQFGWVWPSTFQSSTTKFSTRRSGPAIWPSRCEKRLHVQHSTSVLS